MLKPLFTSIFLSAAIFLPAQISTQITERLYKIIATPQSRPNDETATVLAVTHNGLAVFESVDRPADYGIVLDRFDSCGDVLWRKYYTYGPLQELRRGVACVTPDHGYLLAGGYDRPNISMSGVVYQTVIFKLDSVGTIQWTRTIGNAVDEQLPAAVATTPDGGYVVDTKKVFYTTNCGSLDVYKLDAAGNISWNHSFGNSPSFVTWHLAANLSGKIFLSYGWNSPNPTYGLLCLDASGNTIYNDSLLPPFNSMLPANDSTLAFYYFQQNGHPVLFEIDENTSNVLWTKNYFPAGQIDGGQFAINNAGNIMMMMGEILPSAYGEHLMIILTDKYGDSLTTSHYPNVVVGANSLSVCAATPDTGVAVYFLNTDLTALGAYALLKLNGECYAVDNFSNQGIHSPTAPSSSLHAFPNPADDHCTVLLPGTISSTFVVQRVDALGRTVEEKNFQVQGGNEETTLSFQTASWLPGIYTLHIADAKQVYVSRVIIAR